MSMGWIVNSTLDALLPPPLNLILLCALGLLLRRRWPRGGMALSAVALIVLVLISTRPGASLFIDPLERLNAPLLSVRTSGAQAIVVLGGSRISNAPEYGGQDIPASLALQRLRYAARLHRETTLPILVSGGMPDGSPESEAAIMARALQDDFSVPVKWLEPASDNTAQNAQFSARILKQVGVRRILLVTDAMHMERAKKAFMQTGLEVVAAPTVFLSTGRSVPSDFLPRSIWLQHAAYALHEWIGIAWYQLRHRNPAD